ncbi:phage baseplate assembly protein [Pectobacterium aroidearum]|uniref:phage baseplate assembly protein domain-containing protein n=1 Tax=Pectobacterium aroidearum TaxID=1201031 RepID=UPI002114781B|nr:phage baseplate assembly protein [Pectobacterium aroidearum]UUE37975.1 phage baseplate assembly protein [Pectobacterium aroidearum]UUE42350.1 phage baseplate assembly protein [Pectobacterium aroidearum]
MNIDIGFIRRLATRVAMMLGVGKITAQDDGGVVQTVQYQTPLEVVGNTPRMAEFGFSSGLPVGTNVVIGFLGGDRSSAVILASSHPEYRHKNLKPGEVAVYNQWGMVIHLTEEGIVVEANGKPVIVNNATKLTATATDEVRLITPKLMVTGDIIDNCDSNTTTMKELRDAYNEHDHSVDNVQPGNASITSKAPGRQVK